MYATFEEWFEAFKAECERRSYYGPIDMDSFSDEFESGKDPVESAVSFVAEMNE